MNAVNPYPNYKSTGLQWFKLVPEHWNIQPMKHALDRNDGGVWGDDSEGDEGTIVLRSTEQTEDGKWKIIDPAYRSLSTREAETFRLRKGDLLVTKSSGSALHLGKTTLVDSEVEGLAACYSNFMQRLRTSKSNCAKYLWYVLRSQEVREQINLLSTTSTGLANLTASVIGSFVITAPPFQEQLDIAAFLDRETAEIDEFIADQEELIALLNERRAATVTQAVTKGLDLTVQMKDSGIEWLGEVPQGWRTASLRHLLASKLKYGANEAAEFDDPDWVRYLRITDFGYDGKLKDETFKSLPPEVAADYMVKPNDILLARSGATVGKAFIVPEDSPPSCFAGYLIKVECDPKLLLPRFAYRYFQSTPFVDWKNASQTVATIQNIGADKYATLPMPVPPIDEQEAITDYLDFETGEIDAAIADAKEAIELSKERRAALISAVVTGKIDVRNHTTAELGAA